jgi:hypothetical protein
VTISFSKIILLHGLGQVNVKIRLKEIGYEGVNWIQMVQNMAQKLL